MHWLAVLAAIGFSATYLLVAATRIAYPYDLDFIEDSMLMQAWREAQAQPVYAPPSAEFVPHVYMPLYTWLGGLLFDVTGPGFAPLRLLSFAATIATALMLYYIAWRECGRRWAALACAGLWLGGYGTVDGWYELARVDTLFIALSLAGLMLGIARRDSTRGLVASAIVLALASFTKQTGVVFAAALAIYLWAAIGRRVWIFVAAYALPVVSAFVALNALTDGWFLYYTFHVASSNPIEVERVVDYLRYQIFGSMAGLAVMALGAVALALRRLRLAALRERPWLLVLAAAFAISGMGRASVGGAVNNLIPVYALLCLSPALLLHEWEAISNRFSRPASRWARSLAAFLIVIQFVLGAYNPSRFIPTAEMRRSGDQLIARLASIDGEVFVMLHPYYALLAGKQPSAQIALVWHTRDRGAAPLPDDLVQRLESRYYAAIVSDDSLFESDSPLARLLDANYVRSESLDAAESPPTMTGMFARPVAIYVPRR